MSYSRSRSLCLGLLMAWVVSSPALATDLPLGVVILAKEASKCNNNYRPEYTLKTTPFGSSKELYSFREKLRTEMRGTGERRPYVWADAVLPGQCLGVALVQMRKGDCSWETYTWRIGASESAVTTEINDAMGKQNGVIRTDIVRAMCLPKGKDTSLGVRG